MRKSPSRQGEGLKSIVFRSSVLFQFVACQFLLVQGHPRLDRISPWKIEKKPWAYFRFSVVRCVDRRNVIFARRKKRRKERGKGRKEERGKNGNAVLASISRPVVSWYKTETLQRELDCPSWLTIYLIAIVFYAPTVYFCFRGPSVFHLSYVRGGCYQVEELLVRGWSVRIGKTINRRYYFCRIISQSRNRRRSWSS